MSKFHKAYCVGSVVLTILSMVLCNFSIEVINKILPNCPSMYAMGLYTPIPPVRIFHGFGIAALLFFQGVGLSIVFFARKTEIGIVKKLLAVGIALHLIYLVLASLSFSFETWRALTVIKMLQ